jgi:hypothetical protein
VDITDGGIVILLHSVVVNLHKLMCWCTCKGAFTSAICIFHRHLFQHTGDSILRAEPMPVKTCSKMQTTFGMFGVNTPQLLDCFAECDLGLLSSLTSLMFFIKQQMMKLFCFHCLHAGHLTLLLISSTVPAPFTCTNSFRQPRT